MEPVEVLEPVQAANGGDPDVDAPQPAPAKPAPPRGIYIIRMPRRENKTEDEETKKLQEQLKATLTKMKALRDKRQGLRVRERPGVRPGWAGAGESARGQPQGRARSHAFCWQPKPTAHAPARGDPNRTPHPAPPAPVRPFTPRLHPRRTWWARRGARWMRRARCGRTAAPNLGRSASACRSCERLARRPWTRWARAAAAVRAWGARAISGLVAGSSTPTPGLQRLRRALRRGRAGSRPRPQLPTTVRAAALPALADHADSRRWLPAGRPHRGGAGRQDQGVRGRLASSCCQPSMAHP